MNGPLARHSEVARCINDPCSEMPLPYSIDDDPYRDRLCDNRLSQLQASAAVRETRALAFRKDCQETTGHDVTEIIWTAAEADRHIHRRRQVGDTMNIRINRRHRLFDRVDLFAQCRKIRSAIGAQLALESPATEQQQPGFAH